MGKILEIEGCCCWGIVGCKKFGSSWVSYFQIQIFKRAECDSHPITLFLQM